MRSSVTRVWHVALPWGASSNVCLSLGECGSARGLTSNEHLPPGTSPGSLRAVALGGAANLLLWDLPPPPPPAQLQQQQQQPPSQVQQHGPRQGLDGSGPGAGLGLGGSQGSLLDWMREQEPHSQSQGQGAGEQGPRRTRGAQRDQEREEAEAERARQKLETVVGWASGKWLPGPGLWGLLLSAFCASLSC